MIERGRMLAAVLLAGLAGACGHPDSRVVDQYFNAVKQKDTQTVQSFAAVQFDKPVDSWKIKETIEETTVPAPLTDLVAKANAADKAVNDNKKAAGAYNLDHYAELDQLKAARKDGGAVPAKLAAVAAKWDEFNENDRKFKRELAQARDAVEKEKRSMARSIGSPEGLEGMTGELKSKKLLVTVTSKGEPADYVMLLLKYEVKAATGQKVMSRWVIQAIDPKV